jgi:guanidinopropionase
LKHNKDYQPLSGRVMPRFAAIKSFFRLPILEVARLGESVWDEKFDIALVGVPFDGGTSYRPGARLAPTRVREVSSLGRSYHWESKTSVFEKINAADLGDIACPPVNLDQSYTAIETFIKNGLKKSKRILSCGGDHSVTLPILRAHRAHFKKPLAFIHFDAHLDTYPAAWGNEYHHGSFVRHAIEEKLIDPKRTLQIGIRGPLASQDDLDFVTKHKMTVITIDHPTYLSFDVDALDPAYAPGTGTPVIGGLTSYEAQRILRSLKIKNLVGGDVVEVNPAFDHGDITSLFAVDVLFEMLRMMTK